MWIDLRSRNEEVPNDFENTNKTPPTTHHHPPGKIIRSFEDEACMF